MMRHLSARNLRRELLGADWDSMLTIVHEIVFLVESIAATHQPTMPGYVEHVATPHPWTDPQDLLIRSFHVSKAIMWV